MQPPAFRFHTENEIGRTWAGQGGSRRWRCGTISMLCSRAMPTSLLRRSCTASYHWPSIWWCTVRVHASRRRSQKKDAGRHISKSSAFEITSWTGASTAMQPENAPQKVFSQCRFFHAPRVTETEKETNANLPGWRWKKPKVTHVLFFKDRAKFFKDISWCPSFIEDGLVVWKIRIRERREEGPFGLVFLERWYIYILVLKSLHNLHYETNKIINYPQRDISY